MKNMIQKGHTLRLTAPADVVSGQGLLIGSLFVIAAHDAKSGEKFEAETCGVLELAKDNTALTECGEVYWDNTNKVITATATSNTLIGVASEAAATGDAKGRVRLNGTSV